MEREGSAEQTTTGELYRGFGDGQSRAIELAVTPVILAGLGHLLDRWTGMLPALTIAFFVIGMVGLSARLWYGYDARMRVHEARGPWAPR